MQEEELAKLRLPRAQFSSVAFSKSHSRKNSPAAATPFDDRAFEEEEDSHEYSTSYAHNQSKLQVQTDLLSLVISEYTSSVESQDE